LSALLAVAEILCSLSLRYNFDRGAFSPSLLPPQAALGLKAQSKRATNPATPRYSFFALYTMFSADFCL